MIGSGVNLFGFKIHLHEVLLSTGRACEDPLSGTRVACRAQLRLALARECETLSKPDYV